MSRTRPNIYEYLSYRDFVKDMYHFKKNQDATFSHRNFSRLAGFKSSNFLKLIMDGKRNLSTQGIYKFAKALKLTKTEMGFFETLVLFNQAKTTDEKNHHYARIAQSKSYNHYKPLEATQYRFFSNWYFVAMRELIQLSEFSEDPRWINKKLGLNLPEHEIKTAIQTLIDLDLIHRDDRNQLKQRDGKISTPPDLANLAVHNFHKEMMKKASDSLEKSRTVDRDISTLTVSLNQEQFGQIKERINQFRKEIHALAEKNKNSAEAVYQVNFQLFNLTEVPWNSKK